MSSSIREEYRRRVRDDEDILAAVNARLHRVEGQRRAAADALAGARARFDNLDAEELKLRNIASVATQDLADSRATSLRACVAAVPADVLRCVFEALADLPDEKWRVYDEAEPNAERTRRPFAVAAVCRRWRAVALRTSRIWTYITLDSEMGIDALARQRARIAALLSRSGPALLDLVLVPQRYEVVERHDPCTEMIHRTFSDVVVYAARWRRVAFKSMSMDDRSHLDVFRGPLPVLEQLSIMFTAIPSWERVDGDRTGYFPHAPRLRDMSLFCCSIGYAEGHPGLPQLARLHLVFESMKHALRYLALARETLEEVVLDVLSDEALTSFTLPRLRSLTLRDAAFKIPLSGPSFLGVPCLRRISLHSEFLGEPNVETFLQHVSGTVTELALSGDIAMGLLEPIAALRNVTHLQILKEGPFHHTKLYDNFFDVLATTTPSVLPKLSSIVIRIGVYVAPRDGGSIVNLLTARNARVHHDDSTAERPAKLKEVVLDYNDVPFWVLAEVARLVSANDSDL